MPEFWYHATFDESVELLRTVLRGADVSCVHSTIDVFGRLGFESTPIVEHREVDDALREALSKQKRVQLALPSTQRPLPFVPSGPSFPTCVSLDPAALLMTLDLGKADDDFALDTCLSCPDEHGPTLENLFDDVVELMKRGLVQADLHGARIWVSPGVHARMASPTYRIRAHGPLPRRRRQRLAPIQIEDRAGDGGGGTLRFTRGDRPPAEIVYEPRDGVIVVTTLGEAPEDHYVALFDVCAEKARAKGMRLGHDGDPRSARILAEERRFGNIRAPAPPFKGEVEVDVPAALARLCRDRLMFGENPPASRFGSATVVEETASVEFYPLGIARRWGFEGIERWRFAATRSELEAIGARRTKRLRVQAERWEPNADDARIEIERVLTPLVVDGAIRHRRVQPHRDAGFIGSLQPLFVELCSALDESARQAAVGKIVETMVATPHMLYVRCEDVAAALRETPLAPGKVPRTEKRLEPLGATPEISAAIATLYGAQSFVLISLIERDARGETVTSSLRSGGPKDPRTGRMLHKVVRTIGAAPEVCIKGDFLFYYEGILDELVPFVRAGGAAPPDCHEFEIWRAEHRVRAFVPREIVRAVPQLRRLLLALGGSHAAAEGQAGTVKSFTKAEVRARLERVARGLEPLWALEGVLADGETSSTSVLVHPTGVVSRTRRLGATVITRPCDDLAPRRIRSLTSRLVEAQFPGDEDEPFKAASYPRAAIGVSGWDQQEEVRRLLFCPRGDGARADGIRSVVQELVACATPRRTDV